MCITSPMDFHDNTTTDPLIKTLEMQTLQVYTVVTKLAIVLWLSGTMAVCKLCLYHFLYCKTTSCIADCCQSTLCTKQYTVVQCRAFLLHGVQ
jgi:hypothetical protein